MHGHINMYICIYLRRLKLKVGCAAHLQFLQAMEGRKKTLCKFSVIAGSNVEVWWPHPSWEKKLGTWIQPNIYMCKTYLPMSLCDGAVFLAVWLFLERAGVNCCCCCASVQLQMSCQTCLPNFDWCQVNLWVCVEKKCCRCIWNFHSWANCWQDYRCYGWSEGPEGLRFWKCGQGQRQQEDGKKQPTVFAMRICCQNQCLQW